MKTDILVSQGMINFPPQSVMSEENGRCLNMVYAATVVKNINFQSETVLSCLKKILGGTK